MFMFSVPHAELPEKVFLSKKFKVLFPPTRRRDLLSSLFVTKLYSKRCFVRKSISFKTVKRRFFQQSGDEKRIEEDVLRSYLVICINEKGRCVAGDEMRAVRSGDVSCVRPISHNT